MGEGLDGRWEKRGLPCLGSTVVRLSGTGPMVHGLPAGLRDGLPSTSIGIGVRE